MSDEARSPAGEATPAHPVVTLELPSLLAALAGSSRVQVAIASSATVGDVLDRLALELPWVERRLRDESGSLRAYVNVYVDGADARTEGGLEAPVAPGSRLLVVPSVAGG